MSQNSRKVNEVETLEFDPIDEHSYTLTLPPGEYQIWSRELPSSGPMPKWKKGLRRSKTEMVKVVVVVKKLENT